MKNEIFQIASAAVIIVILITTLRGMKQEYAVVLSVMGAVLLLLWGMERIEPIAQMISEVADSGGVDEEYSMILLKSLGISAAARLAHDVCNDAGETAIASKVDFCGRITLLLISLPLFEQLLSVAAEILSA